jgi:hypothetical protein
MAQIAEIRETLVLACLGYAGMLFIVPVWPAVPSAHAAPRLAPHDLVSTEFAMPWMQTAASEQCALTFQLELIYLERILVPKGSQLNVHIEDANRHVVFDATTTTEHDAPPYIVPVRICGGATFPLKIDTVLVSRLGHRFSQSTALGQLPGNQSSNIRIILKML